LNKNDHRKKQNSNQSNENGENSEWIMGKYGYILKVKDENGNNTYHDRQLGQVYSDGSKIEDQYDYSSI